VKLVPDILLPARTARIARPRATRLFVTRRRVALLSMFAIAAAFPIGGHLVGLNAGSDTTAALAAMLRDPLAMLEGRSPGQRGEGAMFQTKPAKERVASALRERGPVGPEGPVERVLPVVRERPADIAPPLALGGPEGLPGPVAPFGLPGPGPEFGPQAAPGPDGPPLATTSSSGGGTSGGTPPGDPGGIPEPSTWAMMILGFGLVGAAVRRQTAARRALPAEA